MYAVVRVIRKMSAEEPMEIQRRISSVASCVSQSPFSLYWQKELIFQIILLYNLYLIHR